MTSEAHRRIEQRFDAVVELTDPVRRPGVLARYAALHIPADAALKGELANLEGLQFSARSRAKHLLPFAGTGPLPSFPAPTSRAEALGLLYVLEGSTLGGKIIRRELAERGVKLPELGFLDPYGSESGRLWREFLAVLDREVSGANHLADVTLGALRGFNHAETILCGNDR